MQRSKNPAMVRSHLRWALSALLCVAAAPACGPAEPKPASTTPPAPKPGRPAEPDSRPAAPVARASARRPGPPLARRQNITDTIHGVKVADPYRWLENIKSAETQAWLKRMAGYGRTVLDRLPGRGLLEQRLKELSYLEWLSPPYRRGRRFFLARQHKDKEKVVFYWRQGERGNVRVLLDPNTLSKDGSIAVRGLSVDYQGRNVAYKLSLNNADESTLYVMDVATHKKSPVDVVAGAKYAHPSWTPKGDGFYYTRIPVDKSIKVADRPGHAEVYFHKLGTDSKGDRLVHPKTGDPRTFISPQLSRDGRFLFIYIHHGWTSTDVYLKDFRARKAGDRKRFRPLVKGVKALYSCYAWKGRIYVHTNEGAPNYRLFKIDPRRLDRQQWKEIVPERKDAVLNSFAIRGDHLALQYLHKAVPGRPNRQADSAKSTTARAR